MHDSVLSSIHVLMPPDTKFSDSMSPNIQQHSIVPSQNQNSVGIPSLAFA
jgi:hypothetical protein